MPGRRRHASTIAAPKSRSTAAPAPTRWCCGVGRDRQSGATPTRPPATPPRSSNFQNVDASALSTGDLDHAARRGANIITGGSGNDMIDGGGGADVISAGGGNDSVSYHGTEMSIDGGARHQHAGAEGGGDRQPLANADQTIGDRPTSPISRTSMRRRCRPAVSDHRLVGAPTPSPAAPATTRSTAAAAPTSSTPAPATIPSISRHRSVDRRRHRHRHAGHGRRRQPHAVNFAVAAGRTRPPATPSASPISRTSTPAR